MGAEERGGSVTPKSLVMYSFNLEPVLLQALLFTTAHVEAP